jgi:acyl-CoA thioesterase
MRMSGIDVEHINTPGFNRYTTLMGIRFDQIEAGRCRACVDVRDDHFHPGGVVHGGVAFGLADSAMAHAVLPTLESGQNCSTIEIKISYLASVTQGTLECEAVVIRRGRRVVFLEAKVQNGEKLVATATGTFAIIGG